jgi:hypothetical protein
MKGGKKGLEWVKQIKEERVKKRQKRKLESRAGHHQWKKSAKTDIANQQLTPDNH